MLPDTKTDIQKIHEIIGDHYHQAGAGAVVALASEGHASHCFDGDASVILELLAELAAVALVQASSDRAQMEKGLMQYILRVAQSSSDKYTLARQESDVTATMVLDEANIAKMREVLKS